MNTNQFALALISLAASLAMPLPCAAHDDHGAMVVIRDDCDPSDPAWTPSGGCLRKEGDVNFAQFGRELSSPLSAAVVGHQAWRNDPPYLEIEVGERLQIRNRGGRTHTFTHVQNYGGGKIPNPALNKGLVTAPECPASIDIPAGGKAEVSGLAEGDHHFQCCIHPWMRALIKVKPED
jgi:plastocyanin